jgi:hypothetical protein
VRLNKQDPRAQKLAREIAELIRRYELETDNRVEGMSIEKPALGLYDVQLRIRLTARSLATFTHSTSSAVAGEEGE